MSYQQPNSNNHNIIINFSITLRFEVTTGGSIIHLVGKIINLMFLNNESITLQAKSYFRFQYSIFFKILSYNWM